MNPDNYKFDAVVISGGEYPTAPIPLQVIEQTPYVVCCDGAANHFLAMGGKPHAIVGDGDSLSEENRRTYAHLLHLVAEQETNDQTKAVQFLLQQGKRKIAIVGATGKREDHTLGNISLLADYARAGVEVSLFTDYGVFLPCRDTTTFASAPGRQVSIFNISACNLRSEGLRYPLYDFNALWQGTLNESLSHSFTVFAKGEYLVFLNY